METEEQKEDITAISPIKGRIVKQSPETFCLSNKIWKMINPENDHIHISDVKEFIKQVKQIFDLEDSKTMSCFDIIERIDKLAGEKLI